MNMDVRFSENQGIVSLEYTEGIRPLPLFCVDEREGVTL